jgi:hypothetical protein
MLGSLILDDALVTLLEINAPVDMSAASDDAVLATHSHFDLPLYYLWACHVLCWLSNPRPSDLEGKTDIAASYYVLCAPYYVVEYYAGLSASAGAILKWAHWQVPGKVPARVPMFLPQGRAIRSPPLIH